ncbi:VPS10 domain-containing receptor SorCS3 [Thelohanellus kitauei]|uniref:VPS10 domain-containing receptor SorCS3 n=1 Tax=Thelohanellus kitauei TaxID=669202 RepID=A0A0C2NC27_THEKT|nr:VPS10 domain-containing receptor SorCS3 [Thelohanellus kitauei]
MHQEQGVKKFYLIRNQFIFFEYDENCEKSNKIGILHLDKIQDKTLKNYFNKPHRDEWNRHHYILAGKDPNDSCLYTINKYDELVKLICNLTRYDTTDNKCSFLVNPYLFGVIYANFKTIDSKTRTYYSMDNGKNFLPIKFKTEVSACRETECGVEMDLICSNDFIKNHFPGKWIVQFEGTYQGKGSASHRIFISFTGGKGWKMLDSQVERLAILPNGWLMFGTERFTGRIWYSYNEGLTWHKEDVGADYFIDIIPLESPNNNIIAAINYNYHKSTFSVFTFDFSTVLSNLYLTPDRLCTNEDFEIWYELRYFGTCFQGREISYMKIKPAAMCVDNRNLITRTVKECPCSFEDFHCKPYYHAQDNFCVLDPHSNHVEPATTCPDGLKALRIFNGYKISALIYFYSFRT